MNHVHVIEDNAELRKSLCLFLETEGFRAEPHFSATDWLERLSPDTRGCVLASLANGAQLLPKISGLRNALSVVIITGETRPEPAVEVMKMSRVADLIVKPFDPERILGAIRAALAEAADPQEFIDADATRAKIATLSPIQHEVMKCMVRGLNDKLVAAELRISLQTAATRRDVVMAKMGAKGLPHLIRMVLVATT